MTEIGMALGNPYEGPREPGNVGVPFPGVSIKLVSEDGENVANIPNVPGELYVKSNQIFKEYWRRPEATKECLKDGW
jgi:malonyl-CoA/methylmalonyl-CoA synthetase